MFTQVKNKGFLTSELLLLLTSKIPMLENPLSKIYYFIKNRTTYNSKTVISSLYKNSTVLISYITIPLKA